MRVREVSGSRWEISLRTGGWRFVRYALRDPTDWRKGRSPFAQCNRATEEQKREGWEMAVRIEKIVCTVLNDAQKGRSRRRWRRSPRGLRGSLGRGWPSFRRNPFYVV